MALGVYKVCDASSSYAIVAFVGGNIGTAVGVGAAVAVMEDSAVDGYLALDTGISALGLSRAEMLGGTDCGHVQEFDSGIQSSVTFCGINNSSGMSGMVCERGVDVCEAQI